MIEDRLTLNFQIAERLRLARGASRLSLAQLSDRTAGKVSVPAAKNVGLTGITADHSV